jgi:putative chitinase
VKILQAALLAAGFDPQGDDGVFGPDTEAAVERFQTAHGLDVDGIVGPATGAALDLVSEMPLPSPAAPGSDITALVTPAMVAPLFPDTPPANIAKNLAHVLTALSAAGLGDRAMVLTALGTIRAETASFEPIPEGESKYNTSGESHPFDLYDGRSDLGNGPAPDGALFKGRGFVQLTGRANYTFYGGVIGQPLAVQPDLACDPVIAGKILAAFLQAHETRLRAALADNDLASARRLVNGGAHGLGDFIAAYTAGLAALPG